jgi:hypothetical protein
MKNCLRPMSDVRCPTSCAPDILIVDVGGYVRLTRHRTSDIGHQTYTQVQESTL